MSVNNTFFKIKPVGLALNQTEEANKLFPDITHLIFSQYVPTRDYKSFSALACVNTRWNHCSKIFWDDFLLKELCSVSGRKIQDAKAHGIAVGDRSVVNKLVIFKYLKKPEFLKQVDLRVRIDRAPYECIMTRIKWMELGDDLSADILVIYLNSLTVASLMDMASVSDCS
jgi:hypothetical protein